MTAPGPTDDSAKATHEQQHRQETGLAAGEPHRAVRQAIEGAVRLGQREQQRDAGQREEERRREARRDLLGAHAGREGADQPGERHRRDADVELRRHRQRDGDQQRDERQDGGVHAGGCQGGSRCFCSLPIALRGSASTRMTARGILKDARLAAQRSRRASRSTPGRR